jgi:hypothetical protein
MPWYTEMSEQDVLRLRGDDPLWTDQWVRVMCDFAADGVWTRDGAADCVVSLPINLDLMNRILRWQGVFEETDRSLPEPFEWTDEELTAFAQEGLAIAIEMKQQLPGWTVIYHDASRIPFRLSSAELASFGSPERGPRAAIKRLRPWFEYEVDDEVVRTGQAPDNFPA